MNRSGTLRRVACVWVSIYNDGMRGGSPYGTGNVNLGWQMNQAASAELTFDTSGQSAEIQGQLNGLSI